MELYLDNASTSKIDDDVLKEYINLLSKQYASTGSLHSLGVESLIEENKSKEKIANLLKVKPSEILFDSGATEGNNFAIKGVALNYKNRGHTIITSKVEHPSVMQCFQQLEKDFNFKCLYVDVDEDGIIDLKQLENYLNNDVILVSIMAVNHEVGAIMPLKQISQLVRKYPKIIFHSDITQAIGKIKIDLSLVDIATMSAHKIHGIKGSGFIYKKEKVNLYPLISGHPANNALRAGTSNFPSNIVLSLALEKSLIALNKNFDNLCLCQQKIINLLKEINGVVVNTNPNKSIPSIINFSLIGYNPEVVIRDLSTKGIYVSSKSACSVAIEKQASTTLMAMNKNMAIANSSIRISFDVPLNDEEITFLISSLKETMKNIKKYN